MKKKFFSTLLIGSMLALPISMIFSGCGEGQTYSADKNEVYVFSALSSAEYLTSLQSQSSQSKPFGNLNAAEDVATERPPAIADDIEKINKYAQMFDGYLANNGFTPIISKPSVETDGEEYANYTTKIVISVPSFSGVAVESIMYFTEINSVTDIEIDEDDELEVESSLFGVMLFNNNVFDISGEKSVEQEGADSEIEIEFTTKLRGNPSSFIRIQQEMERDEIEFMYSIHENGHLQSKAKVEWIKEDSKAKLSMQFMDKTSGKPSNIKYSFEQNLQNENKIILVKYKNKENTEHFIMKDNGDSYTYTYKNGFSETIKK